ncbi:DUF2933 domain-containing protein [Bradyrhizobium sp. CCGE-LA001]|uniref:DUF2933 domain-containing protein n=1 Tax=Bradyrhizobium sp. CCGE-LA001 TaxID=1223566 RepID=UPI0002F17624|nr:DUF2933 domain-containing protein [Bradyrhizobium sp. CCGE-LA001]
MTLPDHAHNQAGARRGLSRNFLIILGLSVIAAIAGALLFAQHQAHVLGTLLWLPLLACPLVHFFMHGRHRGGGHHHG